MNSFVIPEALIIGVKEGAKAGLVWLLFYSYLVSVDKKNLMRSFRTGFFFSFAISLAVFLIPQSVFLKELLGHLIVTSFALFFIASAAMLFHASGVDLFQPFNRMFKGSNTIDVLLFFSAVLYFLPDFAANGLFLKDLGIVKEREYLTYASALAGFIFGGTLFFVLFKYANAAWIGSYFGLAQLVLVFSLVKLLGGGIKGFAELSLVPSVQRGFMKFFHDVIHQFFVLLMVPDHPLLKTTAWNFIGFFFGSNFGLAASLIALLLFPIMFIRHSLLTPVSDLCALSGAEKRKEKYKLLSSRRRKALPVIFFICFIIFAWFSKSEESVSQLYTPKPRPVVEDKGFVLIPLRDPSMDLKDGLLHKFSLRHDGEEIRLIIIKRSDNTLSVCLDACEICPPRGYGQRDTQVVCIYCNTPVPVNTLGQAGGCNPIPVYAVFDDNFVRIEVREIVKKWEYVKTGKSRETVK